jgi:VCBS repeat-containing protein
LDDNSAGDYSVTSSLFAYLGTSDIMSVSFDYFAEDPAGLTSLTNTITVNVQGTNTAPTIQSVTTSIADTTAVDNFAAITGTIVADDMDADDNASTLTYGIKDGVSTTNEVSLLGTYGTLTVNKTTGAYSYEPNDTAINALRDAQTETDSFTITVTDRHGVTTQNTFTVNLTGTNDKPVITASDVTTVESSLTDATQELLQTIVTDEDGIITLNLSTSNSLIVGLFNQVDIESLVKSGILKLLPANYQDNITLDIDTSVAGTVTVNASITGLPANPFLSVVSQANLKLVLLDHLGSAFNLPFENAVYTGEINVSDVDNISDVKLSLDKISSLSLTTTNKYLISIFEELTSLQPNLSYITNLATDLISGNITLSTTASKTITIPTTAVGLLEKAGLLNILLDETVTNGKAEYKVISPLFNFMKAEDSIKVSFDYKVSDGIALAITDTINVSITGSNDTPVAFTDTVDTRFAIGATSYEGTLPGSYALNMLKDLTITTDLGALKTNIINDIKTNVDVNIDFTAQEQADIKAVLKSKLALTSQDDIVSYLKNIIESSLGTASNVTAALTLDSALKSFVVSQNVYQIKEDVLSLYDTKLNALSNIQTTIESVVAAKTLEITVNTFISTFITNSPSMTFDNLITLSNSISKYLLSDKGAVASGTLLSEIDNNVTPSPSQNVISGVINTALTNTQANIITSQAIILESINTSIFNSLESTFTDFADGGAIETNIKGAISTFTSTYYTADTAGKAAAIDAFKTSVQDILIVNPLAAGAGLLLAEMNLLENAVSISDIQGIDQGTILASLANDITIDSSILNSVLNTALTEIKSYLSTLSLSTLANNPNAIVDTVKDLLDSLFVVIDNVIVDILPTDTELNTTIENALSAEIQTIISNKFDNLVPTPSIISATTLDAISSEIATYLSQEALSKINISINDIKELALESIFTQFGLDTGLLEKASRDVIAEKMVEDLLTRLSMDEDLVDLATLDYSIVAGSITSVVYDENGVDITSSLTTLTPTTVSIDTDGSYKVTNESFASLNTLYNIEVKFDYVVNDGNGIAGTTDKSQSDAQTITLKIALADATVSDGHITGALVFEDLDGDRIHDEGETFTYTNESGDFNTNAFSGKYGLVAVGGNDISTGLAFTGTLTAPAGSTVLSPLTTLIDSLMSTGLNLADAKSLVAATLGISSSIDLTTYDSYAIAKDSTSSEAAKAAANDVQKIAVQIVNIMNQTAAATTDGSAKALTAITDLVKTGETVDLSSSATLTTILNESGVTDAYIIQTVANLNQAIKSATNVDEIAKVQVVANDVQNEIKDTGTIAEVKTVDTIQAKSAAAVINKLPTLEVITNFEISEDNSKTITFTASDLDGTVTTVASAINGTVTVDGANITYTPNAEYNGVDTITVKTTDDKGAYVVKTIAVSILSVNDLPTLDVVSSVSVDEDDNVEVTFSASDAEGIESITTTATNGTVEIIGTNIVYNPNANYNGVDTIVVTVKDNSGSEIVRNIAVTVNDLNDAPTLTVVSTINLNEDGSKTVTFTASDVDGTITTSATASFGTVVINANEITYTPNASFTSTDSITVTVTDDDGAIVEKTILVEVNDVSYAPVAVAQTINDQVDSFVSYEGYLPGSMIFALGNPQIDLKVGDFLNANTVTVTPTFPVVTETQINMLKAGMIVSLGILNTDGSLGANAISYFDQAKINNLKAVVEVIKADVDANRLPDGNIDYSYVLPNLNIWVSGITMKLISEFELGEQTPAEITTFNNHVINYLSSNMAVLTGDSVDFNAVAKDMLGYAKTDFGLTFAEIVNNNIPASLVAAIDNLTAINPSAIVLNIDSALSAYTGSSISVEASAFDSVKTQLSTYLATLNPSDLSNPSVVEAKFAAILSQIDTIVAGQSATAKSTIDTFIIGLDSQITADLNSALDNQIATNVTNFVNTIKAMNPAIDTTVLKSQITTAINSLALADATVDISTSLTAADIKTAILSDFGILGNISSDSGKAAAAATLSDDLYARVGMDGDFEDISTLTYFLSEDSAVATIDGNAISDINVTIDPTGAYSITSKSFATLDSANDVNISFDYYLRDQTGKVSEPVTISVNINTADNSLYLNSELSDETIDGTRTLMLDTNINTNTTDVDLKIFVDGASANSTMIIGDTVLTAMSATQPDNVEITYDGFMITSGAVDTSFVAPTLTNSVDLFAFGYEDDRQDFFVEKIAFNGNVINQNIYELNSNVIDGENIPLTDTDNDGKLEAIGSWGTDELEFGEAKQVTNINGIDVSAYGLYQVAVTFNTFAVPEIEDITDWWDASWMGASTLVELGQKLVDPTNYTSVYTEENSYKLNLTGKTVYNTETNEISGTWENKIINGVSYLVVNIDGDYSKIYTQTENGIEMTERGIPGVTSDYGIWYYGDNIDVNSIKDLLTLIVDNDSFEIPEYDESAPADYYFAFGDAALVEEALTSDITITNVGTEVNVITQLNSNGSALQLITASGDNTFNGTNGDDIITLEDNSIRYIDAENGNDTLDLSEHDFNLDLGSILQNVSIYNIENIDMTSNSVHILSNFTLDEFISLTDEDNTLKILGDGADKISLDSEQNWTQMMSGPSTPYTDPDGFHVYTTTNSSSQTLKLLIEDTITVENV